MPDAATALPSSAISQYGRWTRLAVLAAAFVCAGCGLVYELALIALGSYLTGSSIIQTSVVVSVVMFAMGLGALAAKSLVRKPVGAFAGVELSLALVGGLSVPALYLSFAFLNLYTPPMLIAATAIGALIGAEIPLLMELIQRTRAQVASHAVADLSATDYIGALVGGLAFPFILLPTLGLLNGALAVGIVNAVTGTLLALLFLRGRPSTRARWGVGIGAAAVISLLSAALAWSTQIEVTGRQALYRNPIVFNERSAYQEIVITQAPQVARQPEFRLFLNGDLQFASIDEYRYHEALVHPAMAGPRQDVLILGGGDGLAAREVLKYPNVQTVTMVDLDPAVTRLASTDERLRALNVDSLLDPRTTVVNADAFKWLRQAVDQSKRWDVIIADFPDPDSVDLAKLYSLESWSMAARLLSDEGRLVAQSGSPYFATDAYWSAVKTVEATGLFVTPYHVDVPSFGDWGFALAARHEAPPVTVPADAPPDLRFASAATMQAATVFAPDIAERPVEISTLLSPEIVHYQRAGWRQG